MSISYTVTQPLKQEMSIVGEGISTGILLYLLLFSVTGSIATADWSDDLGTLAFAAAGGVTLAIVLAKLKRLPGWLAHWFSLLLSLPATVYLGMTTLPGALTDEERLIALWERVTGWANRVMLGGSSSDNLVFVLQLCWMMWLIAHFAGWSIYRRHQVWGAIVPTGIAIVVNLFYAAPQTGLYIGLYILCAMLLLVRMNLQTLENEWRRAAVGYSSDISFDFLWNGAVITLILLAVVWIIPASPPSPAWLEFLDPVQSSWQGFEEQFSRWFSGLRGGGRSAPSSSFDNTLTMGGPINLPQRPVMNVQTLYARYWRANVYDKYTGAGWVNTHVDTMSLNANDVQLDHYRDLLRVEVTQTVKLLTSDPPTLYAQSQPIRFDLPVLVRYTRTNPADQPLAQYDVTLIRSRRLLRAGAVYNAVSAISVADEESLRTDSLEYSHWITATYLQLPNALPARVRELAQAITAPHTNPYDKAAALEKYVRHTINYNEQVSAPPSDRDAVDFTLFERPEGYCNYYASTLAVLARSVGIPARVVAGYSLGDYANGTFRIYETNAHAWVEIYFPSYGWIEFEPTATQPELERPRRPTNAAPLEPELEDAASEARRQAREKELEELESNFDPGALPFIWNSPSAVAIIGGGIIGLIAIITLTMSVVTQARRNAQLAPAARVYERMLERARWLGVREEKFATPLERAQIIHATLPNARNETERIAAAYTRERFGARALNETERAELSDDWNKWRGEWLRGLIAYIIERTAKPFRALMENAQRFMRRIERMG